MTESTGSANLPQWAPVIASALRRVSRADYSMWEAAVHAAGLCSQPVRLTGRVYAVDADSGEVTVAYSTARQPDRVLLKACGTRRATRCPACAAVYRADAKTLLAGGLAARPDPDLGVVEEAPMVFVTLTAPSYGLVHTARTGQECRPRQSAPCRHGRPTSCTVVHGPADAKVGAALCPDCYDWYGAVMFNARLGELWRRTVIATPRSVAEHVDVPVRRFAASYRLEYAKVVEFQARGLVHVHALARLDSRPDPVVTVTVDGSTLAAAFLATAAKVGVENPLGRDRLRWGRQADAAVIPADRRRAAAAYLAKYAIKSVDGAGQLDRRLREGSLDRLDLPDQLARMATTAWALADHPGVEELHLRAWAHSLGYRGHWLTKSRHWSTTFTELRDRRHRWRLAQAGVSADDVERRWGEWDYQGVGHLSAGDAWLAASANRERRWQRRTAWEER